MTREEALEAAIDFLSNETREDIRRRLKNIRGRLKIVDHIPGAFCSSENIDLENSRLIYVASEQPHFILDGEEHYIVVNKTTGAVNTIRSCCG